MIIRPGIFFLIIFLCIQIINAQEDSENFRFKGIIINKETQKPVAYCNIFNESKRLACISDTNGIFTIRASIGDTLAFTALGYLGKTLQVMELHRNIQVHIELDVRIYEIDELSFYMPRTYTGFKKAFIETEPPKDAPLAELPKYNPYIRPKLLDTNYLNSGNFKFYHPISSYYYKHNKTEQSLRQVRYLEEQQLRQPEVDAKYNKEMLARITSFTGDTLLNFMLYCNFSFNYLYESTELELVEEIERKKILFIKHCYGQCIPVIVPKKDSRRKKSKF